jgi:hypothetical protein
MIFETAAAISGVRPGASRARVPASQSAVVGEEPVAEPADGEVRDEGEGVAVVRIRDQPGDLVVLVRHDRFLEQSAEREIGQRHLRGDPLLGGLRRDARERVARAVRRRSGEEGLQVTEGVTD